jgi:hypothetical protein
VLGKIGGDPPLTERGGKYAKILHDFISSSGQDDSFDQMLDRRYSLATRRLRVFTSTLPRSKQTADYFDQDFYDVSCVK